MISDDNKTFREVEEDESPDYVELHHPFDPRDIDIVVQQLSLDSVMSRIREGAIDMNPEFQRKGNLWKPQVQSRLIESILIRFPLPAFYFDATDEDHWLVVDGLQRLHSIKNFAIHTEVEFKQKGEQPLLLKGLEFLTELTNMTYDQLPNNLRRRFRETNLTAYMIKPGTPESVKYSVFYRINTGGLILNAQEIRHALNQKGQSVKLLETVAEDDRFRELVNISDRRMKDRELVLRYFAFRLENFDNYVPPMIGFLNRAMKNIDQAPKYQLDNLKKDFFAALNICSQIFGKLAFSKALISKDNNPRTTLNSALFEALTVAIGQMTDNEQRNLLLRKRKFKNGLADLLRDVGYNYSVSSATADTAQIKYRFGETEKLVRRILTEAPDA